MNRSGDVKNHPTWIKGRRRGGVGRCIEIAADTISTRHGPCGSQLRLIPVGGLFVPWLEAAMGSVGHVV